MKFNGSDYNDSFDKDRLTAQHIRVRELMKDQEWRTLKEISDYLKDPEASISAQLRHLRKQRFGSWTIEKRARGDRKNGLYEYRMMSPGYSSEHVILGRKNKYRECLLEIWNNNLEARIIIGNYPLTTSKRWSILYLTC